MPNYHSLKVSTCLRELKSSVNGLTSEEVEKRLKQNGKNELLAKKPASKFNIFFSQFNNPLIYILIAAGTISLLLRDNKEAAIIFGAVALNTVIGYYQEYKANRAIAKLRRLVEHKAIVLRDGQEIEIDSKLLVPGDIIIIKAGNRVPADARLIESINLQVNESALTGESIPSAKSVEPIAKGASLADRENTIYSGTVAVSGSGRAAVFAIGRWTEIGKIAELVSETPEEKTPLQNRLSEFSKKLALVLSVVCAAIFAVGIIQGRGLFEMFLTAVSLAVASIPEGLTISVTVILALGMQQILSKKALTRKLIAAETLGSTTVICADKTGTLTEGRMHVAHIAAGGEEFSVASGNSKESKARTGAASLVLKAAMMCNEAVVENPNDELASWRIIGAPTEEALLSAAIQSGLDRKKLLEEEPKIDELPFNSAAKFMITLHGRGKNKYVLYEKGAPEKILSKSSEFYSFDKVKKISGADRKKLDRIYEKLTEKGLRVIGIATKEIKKTDWRAGSGWEAVDNNLIFIGFIALKDPIRPEAEETIKICVQAGIRPVIITGDHQLTARAIAEEAGMKVKSENIITGPELDNIPDEKLKDLVKEIDIYARVSPHHKLRIINALQSNGEVVAMAGDGINDAPALKAADIGISLGTGSDIAKETSDIVLLDNNFKTIVAAVRQGRIIFSNIRKVIIYLISDSFSEMIIIVGSILSGMPLALLPAQILWINIINDGLPNFSLAYEKGDDSVMLDKPIKRNESILNKEMKYIIFFTGIIRDLIIFAIFFHLFKLDYGIDFVRTAMFAVLGMNSLITIFSLRDLNRPIWKMNPFSNLYLAAAVAVNVILLFMGIYWPPLQNILSTVAIRDAGVWTLILSTGFASMFMIELVKQKFILIKK